MEEIWKDVVDFEGLYLVSNTGEIKSLPRNGTRKEERVLKQKIKWNGRMEVGLNKNDKRSWHPVHRIVAKAFHANPDNLPCVNHIDGNPKNNASDNLEWITRSDNDKHAYRIGLKSMRGDNHNNRKLDSKKVEEIRRLKGQMYHKDIARLYNVSRTMVTHILNGNNWV